MTTISVVMRTKDSAWVVDRALAGLFSQTLGPKGSPASIGDVDLLVVDSGSTDATIDIVSKWPCRVTRIPASSYFPGPVLDAAIADTRGEIVVFQNSDVVPLTRDALARLVAPFEDPRVSATFARQVPRPDAHTWVRRDYAVAFPARGLPPFY